MMKQVKKSSPKGGFLWTQSVQLRIPGQSPGTRLLVNN